MPGTKIQFFIFLFSLIFISCNNTGGDNTNSDPNNGVIEPIVEKKEILSNKSFYKLELFKSIYESGSTQVLFGHFAVKVPDDQYKMNYKLVRIEINNNQSFQKVMSDQVYKESSFIFANEKPIDLFISKVGDVYVLTRERVYRFSLNGEIDSSFGTEGHIDLDFENNGFENYFVASKLLINSKDELHILGEQVKRRNQVFDRFYAIYTFDLLGAKVETFAASGHYVQKRWSRQNLYQVSLLSNDEIVYSGRFQRLTWGGSDSFYHGTICKLDTDGNYSRNFSSDNGFKDFHPFVPLENGLLISDTNVLGVVGINDKTKDKLDLYLLDDTQVRKEGADYSISLEEIGENQQARIVADEIIISSVKENNLILMTSSIRELDFKELKVPLKGTIKDHFVFAGKEGMKVLSIVSLKPETDLEEYKLYYKEL